MAARERRGQYFDLRSNFSSASASNRNLSINIHEWREESVALRCRGRRRGREGFSILPETLFLAASLPLSVYSPCTERLNLASQRQNRHAETKIETSLWSEHAARTARGAASLGRTEHDRGNEQERQTVGVLVVACVLTDQNNTRYRCVRRHVGLLQHLKSIIYTRKTGLIQNFSVKMINP